jgi:hypothetical protein
MSILSNKPIIPKVLTIAAKSAPSEEIFKFIHNAGIKGLEIYTDMQILQDFESIIQLCSKYPFRYSLHAPSHEFEFNKLAKIASEINAEIVTFHPIYWPEEWKEIIAHFEKIDSQICVENISSLMDINRLHRRFKLGFCFDIEHFQMEINGLFTDVFSQLVKKANHIHLTGYYFGSKDWHTPIYKSPQHSLQILNYISESGYSGLVVSEASLQYQTPSEFKNLKQFENDWKKQYFQKKVEDMSSIAI